MRSAFMISNNLSGPAVMQDIAHILSAAGRRVLDETPCLTACGKFCKCGCRGAKGRRGACERVISPSIHVGVRHWNSWVVAKIVGPLRRISPRSRFMTEANL